MKMMNLLRGAIAAGLTLSMTVPVLADSMGSSHMMMHPGKQVSLTATVVDMNCYLVQGLHGPGHVGCAKACILNGQEMGLLTSDGKILPILGGGPNDTPNKKLLGFVEQRVTVTGEEFSGNGQTGILLKTIHKA
jgi:hypothetical protein